MRSSELNVSAVPTDQSFMDFSFLNRSPKAIPQFRTPNSAFRIKITPYSAMTISQPE